MILKKSISKIFNNRAFTLVENVVALAILAIIISAYMGLFTNSFSWIFTAGRKSGAIFNAQQSSDEAFIDGNTGGENISISFPSLAPIKVNGQFITISSPYEDKSISITSFVPAD